MPESTGPWYIHFIPHWPKTVPGAVTAIALMSFIFGAAIWLAHDPRAAVVVALFKKDGSIDQKLEHVFVFTTASNLTKYDLAAQFGDDPKGKSFAGIAGKAPWYYVSDSINSQDSCMTSSQGQIEDCLGAEVLAFKKSLDSHKTAGAKKRIQGYEFYESVGSGQSSLKRGLTWKVTVPVGSTFTRDDLLELYASQWKRNDGIYIEDIAVPVTRP